MVELDNIREVKSNHLHEEQQKDSPLTVQQGFKKTEIGIVPIDWKLASFLNFVDIASGQVDPKIEPYKSMILIAPDHIESGTGRLISLQTAHDQSAISGKYLFKSGDVIYSKIRPYLKKAVLAQLDGLCSADMYPLRPKENISSGYVLSIVLSDRFTKFAESVSVRSGMPKINRDELSQYVVAVPSIAEQTAIANALSDVDALISELEKLIAKKQAIKTATMQQLLTGRTRLPQFALREDGSKKGYKQSELGEIPEDWEVRCLGDFAVYLGSGKTNTKSIGDYPLYGSTGLIGSCKSPEYDGEAILVARVGANAGRLNFVSGAYGVSDNTIIIKLNASSDVQFFRYWLIRKNLNTLVFGSGQPLITGSQLKALLLSLPSREEQIAISTILSDMDSEIQALQQRLTKTRQIKQGMMQELLTGKTRLIQPAGSTN